MYFTSLFFPVWSFFRASNKPGSCSAVENKICLIVYLFRTATIRGVWGGFLRFRNRVANNLCTGMFWLLNVDTFSGWFISTFFVTLKVKNSFYPLFLETRLKQTLTQSGSSRRSADIPVRIHLLTGVSLGLLPSAINHGVIHPPSCTSGEVGPLPFPPRCIWGIRHATDPTHTLMEIYPRILQNQYGCSDGGSLMHPCH